MADELHAWPAHRVAAEIAAGRLASREHLAALRHRVDRYDGDLGLVVTLDERAESAARAADEAVAHGRQLGPLHGVAMTVKDCMCTAGLRTTGGTPDLAEHIPDQDAHAVLALRQAGAVVFGKTNMPDYAADVQTHSSLFGPARNPWNPARTTGGSSGGSAGAVAAGFSPVELGSDVAGSIRIPVSHCGVAGHKPSFGVVPGHGHVPPFPWKYTTPDMAVIGPIARTVQDLELLLSVIAGPHPLDEPAWRLQLPGARPVLRVAVWPDDPYCPVDSEVRAALSSAAEALTADGVRVTSGTAAELGLDIELAESDEVFHRLLTAVASGGYTPEVIEDIAAGRRPAEAGLGARFVAQRHRDWLAANERRAQMRLRWREFFTRYDALLLPVAPNLAGPLDDRPLADRTIEVDGRERPYWQQIVWAGLTGVSYLPSTVVPVALDSRGLPVGVAVAGPYLEDRTTLALAARLARLLPPMPSPPL
ncbi:amidase family protein [Streptomyces sp. BK205]|uniref:amidase family protein n=1 Tax=Streptomyces sp. BK205 TaxID=2512164 RepID=UPI0010489698|nr:amidase family protein [Streptomyces sp. BK205]TCR16045.1 amidase [Streptomyces sp. BK205]